MFGEKKKKKKGGRLWLGLEFNDRYLIWFAYFNVRG